MKAETLRLMKERALQAEVVIIDDNPENLYVAEEVLRDQGYENITCISQPHNAFGIFDTRNVGIVLIDYMMDGVNGEDVLAKLRSSSFNADTPAIMLTANTDESLKVRLLENGANDFITKPFKTADLLARVMNWLLVGFTVSELQFMVDQQTLALFSTNEELLRKNNELLRTNEFLERNVEQLVGMMKIAITLFTGNPDFQDNETTRHMMRVGLFAWILARELGCSQEVQHMLLIVAPFHDVGKALIDAEILNFTGIFDDAQRACMNRHVGFGEQIVLTHKSFAESATGKAMIEAISGHHEEFDGSGHPKGLTGDDIPVIAQLTALADRIDAWRSKRRYKKGWTWEEIDAKIRESENRSFSPALVKAYFRRKPELLEIHRRYADPE